MIPRLAVAPPLPLLAMILLLSVTTAPAWSDEWGEWDDLPDNLLESKNDVRSLEELSQQLDQLIADREGVSGSTQERLLERWLSQLAPDERESLSLDTLLSLPEDWTDDQFESWYESLGDASGPGTIDDDDDEFDDDDDEFDDDDDEFDDDDDLDDDDMDDDDDDDDED